MAENGYGTGPLAGHVGRIPNFGRTQVNPMGSCEPPACIQNAMMTKDKKPFTYTPGGLDLSQIKTPSMARRLARQRSLEEQEQAYAQQAHQSGNYHPQGGSTGQGGPAPPPPPPPQAPAPPPPPPLVIEAPNAKAPKPPGPGERPEIVIPENPIGMLRKTNSPYHWEAEQAELQRMGTVPKFQEKVPSPLTVKMPPSSFSQQPPQYAPQGQNFQRPNYGYGNQNQPESPIHRPEAQYANSNSASPNVNGTPITRELLQRQDSQFNKSPQPFGGQSPLSNSSPYSPSPNNNWRQPERRDSPSNNAGSPQASIINRNQFSPHIQQYSPNQQHQNSPGPVYHTLPQAAPRDQDKNIYNAQKNMMNNNTREHPTQIPKSDPNDPYPWRSNNGNRQREPENLQSIYHNSQPINQQPKYIPPWVNNEPKNNHTENACPPSWKQQENRNVGVQQQPQYTPTWTLPEANNNSTQDDYNPPWRGQHEQKGIEPTAPVRQYPSQDQPRYQSTMSIPVTPRKQNTQPEPNNTEPRKEVVFVNQEPVFYCPESPKSVPPWVKTQKEKTKTPPPAWVQRPLEGRKSAPRELVTPPRETNPEPEWVRKSNELQRGVREVVSPPKYQQPVQPTWSTRPSENRKSIPRDNAPSSPGSRNVPIQMEVNTESRDHNRGGQGNQPLKIMINMQPGVPNQSSFSQPNQQAPYSQNSQAPYSQPTQRIMRVLSPQLVRLDDGSTSQDLPSLNRSFPSSHDTQGPKERIIPIQIEGGGNSAGIKRVYYHKFVQEGPPRQSKAFRVLQLITGTQDAGDIGGMEARQGYTDL